MKTILFVLISATTSILFSQSDYVSSGIIEIEKSGSFTPTENIIDWQSFLFNLEAPFPGNDSYKNYLQLEKSKLPNKIYNLETQKATNSAEQPAIEHNFEGNPFGGIPNDNDIAISNNGVIISVCNSTVYIYHEDSVQPISNYSLDVLADSVDLVANSYDPKVEYDPINDRFILVFLNGNSANATAIVVCFSKTNNPMDGWNIYQLEGNPLDDNSWTDFPAMAINEYEVFITGNLVDDDADSWQTGFVRSVIWQLDLDSGYAGDSSLAAQLYTEINYGSSKIRNLLPIKGGSGPKGSDMYFFSNRNFDVENDTFFYAYIDNNLDNVGAINLTTDYIVADEPYGLPPNATQPSNNGLQTNDTRPLGGYIEDNKLHFVGMSNNFVSNQCAIYHTIWEVGNEQKTCEMEILGGNLLEYGYPNISFTGVLPNDNQCIIGFNHTSLDTFPGVSAIFYSEQNGYSDRINLVTGDTTVRVLGNTLQRWGDYTGNQRKYNTNGEVWISGFCGSYNQFGFNTSNRLRHKTWISAIQSPDSSYLQFIPVKETEKLNLSVYPNPSAEIIYISFSNPNTQILKFELYDFKGHLVKTLLNDKAKRGENMFKLSIDHLQSGVYFLKASASNGLEVFSEKILKN